MKLFFKLLILYLFFLFSVIVSQFVIEKYFFDKFIYKKSQFYGYTSIRNLADKDKTISSTIGTRVKDLQLLFENTLNNQQLNSYYKIAVVGDSFSYGLGIKSTDRYSVLLEQKLSALKKVKVYNFSQPGDDLADNYIKTRLLLDLTKVDVVVISLVDNDLLFESTDKEEKYKNKNEYLSSKKSNCLNLKELKFEWREFTKVEYLDLLYSSLDDNIENICILEQILDDFKELSKEKNTNIAFYFQGYTYLFNDSNQIVVGNDSNLDHAMLLGKIAFKLSEKNLYIISNRYNAKQYSRISNFELHPSKRAHELMANDLEFELTSNPIFSF